MLKIDQIRERLKGIFDEKQIDTLIGIILEIVQDSYKEVVKVSDFNELKEIVRDLAQSVKALVDAQSKTEERLSAFEKATEENFNRVWTAIGKLEERMSAFEKATEENFNRVWTAINELTIRVNQLAEAQSKMEERLSAFEKATEENFNRVWTAIGKLEERMSAFEKATEENFNRVWKAIEELAEAQKRTEERLEQLILEHQETRRQLGGLANTVGYRLEGEAFKALPKLLRRDFGLSVKGRLVRKWLKDNQGKDIEVNIYGEAVKNRKRFVIIGESKVQMSKNNVDDFIRKKLNRLQGVYKGKIFPVLITHMTSEPDVEEYAKEKGIQIYYSFDF